MPVVVLTEPQLAGGAEHPLGELAAELGLLDLHRRAALPCGTLVPTRANGYFLPAVTLDAPQTTWRRSAVPSLTSADAEPVGVGMLAHLLHQADDEPVELAVQRLDAIHRRAQHGETLGDVLGIEGRRRKASSQRRETFIWMLPPVQG